MKRTLALIVALAVIALVAWRLMPRPPPQIDMAVDAEVASKLIDDIIIALNEAYVFPERAAEIERGLRAERSSLESVTSAIQLAEVLTTTLRRLSHDDQHLMVRAFAEPLAETNDADESAQRLMAVRKNGGFETVGRLHGNIGYLELTKFARPDLVKPRLPAAMKLLAETKALIIDLRDCGGGDPESVMLLASYFFDTKTHLNDIYWRDENRTEERFTEPVAEDGYGERRKVYLLVSNETGSGCEDFAYALKNAKRATLIGETTVGAAHAGSPRRLNAHFMMFVPTGRPINPVTHTDWERVGVEPDEKTSAKKALVRAQIAALTELIATETDAEWRGRLERTRDDLD